MKVILLPLDDRPVTYMFPQLVARTAAIEPIVPPRELFGSLMSAAKIDQLIAWIDSAIATSSPAGLILCLDSILYGGLINSRRSRETLSEITPRLEHIKRWRTQSRPDCKVFAQASIMRISDNYDNSEEKAYWSEYGREIFLWSEQLHRLKKKELPAAALRQTEFKIPANIREDYLDTRFRNFQINRKLVNLVQDKLIDRLVFSQDDSGEMGLNVLEKERLLEHAEQLKVSDKVAIYPGADEVLCSLLANWLVHTTTGGARPKAPVAEVKYSPDECWRCPSRYEGQTIGQSIDSQLNACGIENAQTEKRPPNFTLVVHSSTERQGDHILLPGQPDLRRLDTAASVRATVSLLEKIKTPFVLVDVAYANGADPLLVEALLERPELTRQMRGYAGWNTTGNSAGSAIALAVANWYRAMHETPNGQTDESLRRCLFTRLADDWAYQSLVRRELSGVISPSELAQQMAPHIKRISDALGYYPPRITVAFPWKRTFEIEITTGDG